MKRFIFLINVAAATLFTQSVIADGYWGVKAAMVNDNASSYSGNAINAGVFLGVDVAEIGSSPLAIEADINTTLIKGNGSLGATDFKWGTQTTAIYAAMRTGNEDYFKFKLGIHSTKTSVDISGSTGSGTGDGLSYGIGFKINDYEIEYTVLKDKDDSSSEVSLISVAYHFQ